jgi:ketosteroid isomerase-like protein
MYSSETSSSRSRSGSPPAAIRCGIRRNLSCLLGFLLCLTFRVNGQQPGAVVDVGVPESAHDSLLIREADLRRSALAFREAYNRNDVEGLAALYAEDAAYVSPHVPDLMIRGREAIKANWQRGIALGGYIDTIEVLATGSSCDLAYVVSRYAATNSGVKVGGRNILVLRRVNGTWLIVTHASVVRD